MTEPFRAEIDVDLVAEDLAARYLLRLRVFAARRLRDPSAAEDAAQEALRRVLEALRQGRVRDLQALPSYTFETLRHVCHHVVRERQRTPVVSSELACAELPAHHPDPLVALVSAERADQVRRAVASLEPLDREILKLSFADGLPADDIARRLGLTAVNVRVRRHRVLRRLHTLLSVTGAPACGPVE